MSLVHYQVTDRVAFITMSRPDKRNALNDQMVAQLAASFDEAGQDQEVKVIVLKAKGKVFSAGADLQYLQQLQKNSYTENLEDSAKLRDLLHSIYTHSKVVIAQVQGHAIAGGCGLATVCDFIFTQPEAKFGYSEVHIGFVPAIVMVYLIRRIGEAKARDLLLSGHLVDAGQALDMGLVNRVVSADTLDQAVLEFAGKLSSENSSQSMETVNRMMVRVQELPIEDAFAYAVEQNAKARDTDDCKNGIKAFLNKEPIKW